MPQPLTIQLVYRSSQCATDPESLVEEGDCIGPAAEPKFQMSNRRFRPTRTTPRQRVEGAASLSMYIPYRVFRTDWSTRYYPKTETSKLTALLVR